MPKIALNLSDNKKSQIIKLALAEVLEDITFSDDGLRIADADLPRGNFKIGELADKILAAKTGKITIDGIEINPQHKTARYKKTEIALTEIEVKIINFLHAAKMATREELLEKVWGYSSDAATRTVETHIHRLNQKMQENFARKIIESGKSGYKLT